PANSVLQWAKMDLCLAVLRKISPSDQRTDSPPPHDLALSLLAAACARCGAGRIDLARRLFAWMRVRQLGAATHPQSTSVFFERFVQLCAASASGAATPQASPAGPEDRSSGAGGDEPQPKVRSSSQLSVLSSQMSADDQAESLLLEDIAARPRLQLPLVGGACRATLSYSGLCPHCEGRISMSEVFGQWARLGSEETGLASCSQCRRSSGVKLRAEAVQ
ncbi:unnamed protein product, partial [Polarella glacialis]